LGKKYYLLKYSKKILSKHYTSMSLDHIHIRGAREHNLKDISVSIPRDKLVVITGLSGSGKSSLAFDTLYAEGQRRYVESLSAYARQFLQLMQKPDVDAIEGLSPAISIEQKTTSKNPRSTVGTVTEIYDYLRVLYARVGIPYSPVTGLPIESQTITQMVERLMALPEKTKLYLLAPVVRGRKGEYRKELQDIKKQGFHRVKVDGQVYDIDEVPPLDKKKKHTLSILVDRVVMKAGLEERLAQTLETCLKWGEGIALAEKVEEGEEILFSEKFACPVSGFSLAEIEPRLFSFNNPYGACAQCDGLGVQLVFTEAWVVPDPKKSILEGAVSPWSGPFAEYYMQAMESVLRFYGEDPAVPYQDLSEKARKALMFGTGGQKIAITYEGDTSTYEVNKPFEGVIPNLTRRWRETESEKVRESLGAYQQKQTCPSCHGYRLKEEALTVQIEGQHIGQVTDLSVEASLKWFQDLPEKLNKQQHAIAVRVLKEITERLHFLKSVGLGYLTLSRMSGTLSGGESQRIRLASQIGSGLTGVLYVLDEPSIGLHQRDNARLLKMLTHLRDLGNTVVVVEHDEEAIQQADFVIDMGPGAGVQGGTVVAKGTPAHIQQCQESLTGQYLSGRKCVPLPTHYRKGHKGQSLTVEKATTNNLKEVTVSFPLGKFIAVTGVSGGGKSSLVIETLYKGLMAHFSTAKKGAGACAGLQGMEHIDKVIDIDQSPIGRTPRSNPATYTGAFTPIREWFAKLPEAQARGYTAGRFSFNVKGGRCEACRGDGVLKIEMHFLPDVYVTCDQCKGKRYNRETLEVKVKGKNIADILEMTVDEGVLFFQGVPAVRNKLQTLQKVGLGYIHIGQQATTLSGGEAQRIKLSKELSRAATGKTLYILDEPTTGLHFEDVRKLLEVLHTLVDQGNTVVVIEHNLDVVKTADWVIDIGPEGGDGGGHVVAQGTPQDVALEPKSYTGQFLKPLLTVAQTG
jgi:excinuclease ABC subunit A